MIWLACLIAGLFTALLLVRPLLPAKTQAQKIMITSFMLLFIGAALGTYKLIGAPNFQPQTPQAEIGPDQIQAMVDGLAQRLADNPNDPEGWTRLIRSRIVLGDIKAMIEDHKTMRGVFADQPELILQISSDSGFDEIARNAQNTQIKDTPKD